jgi:putative ABC transport system substrate-binding protein
MVEARIDAVQAKALALGDAEGINVFLDAVQDLSSRHGVASSRQGAAPRAAAGYLTQRWFAWAKLADRQMHHHGWACPQLGAQTRVRWLGGGELSALAAKAATSTIPIVFAVGTDPIRSGLAASLRRPDGNLTGVSTFIAEMDSKRLRLLRELRPHATTTAFLVNPKYFQSEIQVSDVQTAAQSVGQDINILNARTIRDIDAAFATLAQMRADALLVATDAFFFTRVTQFVVLSARHAIPTLYSRREFPAAGGLMSYGPNQDDSYRLLGVYAARILKGEKPGDLPIQLPTKFELAINLSTANALGLEILPTLLARADEVIE